MKTLLANLRSCVIALFAMTAVCLNGQKTVQLPAVASYNEAYVLTPDQPQGEGQISIDGSHVEVRFTSVSSTLQVTLVDPSGGVHPAGQTDSVVQNAPIVPIIDPSAPSQTTFFFLSNPPSGMWTYQLNDPGLSAAMEPVLVTVNSDSDLVMTLLGTGGDFQTGGNVMLNLLLVNLSGPIPASAISSMDATVQLSGSPEMPITFADDGANGDVKANDGIYTSQFTVSAAGWYSIRVNAEININGQTFRRSVASYFRAADSCGSLAGTFTTAAVASSGSGQPDAMDVAFDLTAATSGVFHISATLSAGAQQVARGATANLASGAGRITVRFPLSYLTALGANGPYQLTNAVLSCVQDSGTSFISDRHVNLGSTTGFDLNGAINAAIPRNGGIGLTGDNADQGVDSTNSGKFDSLNVSIGVDIPTAGAYQWNASLYDSNGTLIDQARNQGSLGAGRSRVLLTFSGAKIAKNGLDGPYFVRDFCIEGSRLACFTDAISTQPYPVTRFSGASGVTPPPGGGCLPPPANLVSWWSGDGNANDSTGGNNGTVQGGATFAAGEVGQAFKFDGSSGYVSAGNPASLGFTSALTVEAWINPHAAPPANTMSAILTKWAQIFNVQPDSDSYGLWLRQDPTAGLQLFGAIHQAGTSEPNVQGGTIPLNAWSHVAMTFDSGTGTLVAYVNGRAVNSLTSPGAIVTSSRNVFIGREDSFLPRPFNGLIDELSVYNRALSASEIQAIYAAGSAGKCKGTTAPPSGGSGSGNIVSLKIETGAYDKNSKTFTPTSIAPNPVPCVAGPCATFDTDDSTKNWAIGVSAVGATNPLFNNVPKKALKNPLPPGSYYAYVSQPYTWQPVARLTVQWSNGTTDVAYFQTDRFDDGSVWARVDGATNLAMTYRLIQGCKVFQGSTQPPPSCSGNSDTVQLDISPGSGGGGTASQIAVTPSKLDFGSVPVGQPSQSKTITVTNTGASPVTVSLLTSAPFAVSPTSLNLAANGGSGTASVTFTPTSAGSSASSINIDISGQSTPAASVMLTGSGTAATTGGGTGMIVSLTVDPGSYDKNSGTFTVGQPNQGYMSWDTDDSNKTNWIMGVSVPPETSPLLNIPGQKGLKNPIAPGTYYTYYHPESWGNDVRLTVHWSDKTTDVAYFNVAGFGVNQNWPWEGGSPNLMTVIYKTRAVSTVYRVSTTAENTSPGNGAASEVLAITINAGSGSGTGGGTSPQIAVSPQSLDFGSVPVGQPSQSKTITVTNTGASPVTVSLLTSAPFAVSPTSLNLAASGGAGTASVTFTPTSAGSSASSINIDISGQSTPAASVMLTGSGTAPGGGGADPNVLKVDAGTFQVTIGYNQGGVQGYFINRLTPASYPATLRKVIVFFPPPGAPALGLPLGTGIQLLSGTTTSSGPQLTGLNFTQTSGTVTASNTFIEYDVPALTIQSGSFIVGFTVLNPPGVFPAVLDTASPSAQRSYISNDGVNFSLIDTVSSPGPGNWGIRARVDYTGGTGGGTSGACVSPPPNLLSWWSGDGNANDATGGNNGTLQGGATFAAGEVGQAFQFDGSTGYVSAGNPASLQLTSAITVEAWINPHAAPAANTMSAILTKWAQIFNVQPDSDSYGLWLRQDPTAGLQIFGAIHQAGTSEPHVLGGTIPLNTWTHVAMTFDSATGTFVAYVNGQAVNSLTSPGAIVTSSRNVFIGREDSFLPRPFNGLIDEVSVYGRALSASEIQAIYSAGSAGKCKGTTAAGNFSGQWNTDYGPMSLIQNGNSVTGTYQNIFLNVTGTIAGLVSGSVLNANWSDSSGSGSLAFTLSADGNSFTGSWKRLTGSGDSGGNWNGTRATTTTTSCTFALGSANASVDATANTGSVSVTASASSCAWTAVQVSPWIKIASGANGTGNGTVTYSVDPNLGAARVGTITIAGQTFTVNQAGSTLTVLLSDSFRRADTGACSLGQADLALGGSGSHFYLPIFPGTNGPVGANIVSGALQNNGLDFGGVQLAASAGACNAGIRGETLAQDMDIRVDLLVPGSPGKITNGGPYFRSRAAAAGDGIIGGTSAGYWVRLVSTGEVRVTGLNPFALIATTGAPASFNAGVVHTLEAAARGSILQVTLDGVLQTFTQNGSPVTIVSLPATGTNDGTVGIAFSSEDNRGLAGGQRASNLVISAIR
jgi:hypothetical protein